MKVVFATEYYHPWAPGGTAWSLELLARALIARGHAVTVDVTLHFRLTRCSGSLAQGDLLYTTTLMPGEKVRLFSSDRHTRFSYDSETKLSM